VEIARDDDPIRLGAVDDEIAADRMGTDAGPQVGALTAQAGMLGNEARGAFEPVHQGKRPQADPGR
jgi:hypothetical protein